MNPSLDYVLAVILPPLAVLSIQRWSQFILNLLLTCCFWVPGVIHALYLVKNHHRDNWGERRVMREMRQHRLNSILR